MPNIFITGEGLRAMTAQETADLAANAAVSSLSPAQFQHLLGVTGLGDVMDGVEASLKSTGDTANYAIIRAQRFQRSYSLETTLTLTSQFSALATTLFPGVDISEATITAAWMVALTVDP